MLRHRTEHKMGTQGFNTDPRDETKNTTIFDNHMRERVYISSDDKKDGTYSDAAYFNNGSIIKRGVSGIGIESIDLFYCIPNCNGNNNVVRWHETGGDILTATIPIGDYGLDDLFILVVSALNNNIDSDGDYSYTIDANSVCTVTISTDVAFQFDNCSFINNGRSLHGLFYTTNEVLAIKSIPYLQATSYIDIVVSDILNGQIAQSSYGKQQLFNTTQHLARVIIDFDPNTGLDDRPPQHIKKTFDIVNYVPFRHRDIKDLRIQLLDDNNNILWSDLFSDGTSDFEIPYLKYFITLNTVF